MDWHVGNVTDSYPSNVKSEKKTLFSLTFQSKVQNVLARAFEFLQKIFRMTP